MRDKTIILVIFSSKDIITIDIEGVNVKTTLKVHIIVQPKQRQNLLTLIPNHWYDNFSPKKESIKYGYCSATSWIALCWDVECCDWPNKIIALIQYFQDLEQEYPYLGVGAEIEIELGSSSAIDIDLKNIDCHWTVITNRFLKPIQEI